MRTDKGLQLHPKFRERLVNERNELRKLNGEADNGLLEFFQLPEAQVVNRYEGCPATRLIKLSCRMLQGAMQPEAA